MATLTARQPASASRPLRANRKHFSSLIDYFALGLIHALIAIALLRLAGRDATDRDPAFEETRGDGGDSGQAPDA